MSNIAIIFLVGLLFSFISHLADAIRDNVYKGTNPIVITLSLMLRSVLGGILAVVIYYGIDYFFIGVSIELKIGLSSSGAFMSEQISLLVLELFKRRIK